VIDVVTNVRRTKPDIQTGIGETGGIVVRHFEGLGFKLERIEIF
jgi:hypothetical protein